MPNEFEELFEDMLDAAEEVKGFREKCTLGDEDENEPVDVLVFGNNVDLAAVTTGWANAATMDIAVRTTDFPPGEPEHLMPVQVRNRVVAMLTFERKEGHVRLTVGDPTIETLEE